MYKGEAGQGMSEGMELKREVALKTYSRNTVILSCIEMQRQQTTDQASSSVYRPGGHLFSGQLRRFWKEKES